jgi:site-specific recombinase XerD
MALSDSIKVVPEVSRDCLTERQEVDYEIHRERLLTWLLAFGKNPDSAEGYSESTVQNTAYRLDSFYRFVWDGEGYTTDISHGHADDYIRELAISDKSISHKSTASTALKRLFKWKSHEQGADKWEPEFNFSRNDSATNPREVLSSQRFFTSSTGVRLSRT